MDPQPAIEEGAHVAQGLRRVNFSLLEKDFGKLELLVSDFGFTTKNDVVRESLRIVWKLSQMQKQGYYFVAQNPSEKREMIFPLLNLEE